MKIYESALVAGARAGPIHVRLPKKKAGSTESLAKRHKRQLRKKGSARDAHRRLWSLLAVLSTELMIAVLLSPFPATAGNKDMPVDTDGSSTSYALYTSGQVALPSGIRDLRVMGSRAIVTTNLQWHELNPSQRAETLRLLAERLESVQEVIAFHRTGQPAGFSHSGRVEVYP